MTPSFPLRRSEIKRRLGIQTSHRFGLINCPQCHAILTVKQKQKTCRCKKCHTLFWLADNRFLPIYSSDSLEMVRRIRAGIYGCLGSGKFFIPTWKFSKWERRANQARRVESTTKTPTSGDRAERAPRSPKSASGFLPTAQKPDLYMNLGSAPGSEG